MHYNSLYFNVHCDSVKIKLHNDLDAGIMLITFITFKIRAANDLPSIFHQLNRDIEVDTVWKFVRIDLCMARIMFK